MCACEPTTGTGKTSTARVLAGRASLPLVYVPLEMLVSKFYGESEQNMAKVSWCLSEQDLVVVCETEWLWGLRVAIDVRVAYMGGGVQQKQHALTVTFHLCYLT